MQRLARGDVVQHGGVEFALNLGLFLDQQALDRVVADAHAEDLPGNFLGFIRRAGELDAAGLAALAGRHLRLHHAGPDFCRRHRGFRVADAENAARHRNAAGTQDQRFRRVFLEVHIDFGLVVPKAGLSRHPLGERLRSEVHRDAILLHSGALRSAGPALRG